MILEDLEDRIAPQMSALTIWKYEKGREVDFDSKVDYDGKTWISFLAENGDRRYIPFVDPKDQVEKETESSSTSREESKVTPEISQPKEEIKVELAESTTSESKTTESEVENTEVKESEDKKIESESTDSKESEATNTEDKAKESTEESTTATEEWKLVDLVGTYKLPKDLEVKANPKLSFKKVKILKKDQEIKYTQKVEFDGKTWISYIDEVSGQREFLIFEEK